MDETVCSKTTQWMCPGCGECFKTLLMPNETDSEAEIRLINDHIKDGCLDFLLMQ